MWTAVGVGCALLVHVTYTLIGIGLIISQSIVLFSVIKFLGALYIMWLGGNLLFARGGHDVVVQVEEQTYKAPTVAFREGFLTNVLNPKATIFFVSIFTQFVSPELPKIIQAAYGLEVAFIVMSWFLALSVLLTMPYVRRNIGKVQDKLMKVMGVALVLLGVKVAISSR